MDGGDHPPHSKAPSWPGWADAASGRRRFGLELQAPFAERVLSGRKAIETRTYALPPALVSRREDGGTRRVEIDVLESARGRDGASSVPDRASLAAPGEGDETPSRIRRRGWCTFVDSFRYESRERFEADADKHLVDPSSGYGWRPDRPMFGWVVGERGVCEPDGGGGDEGVVAVRRMRSLFEIVDTDTPTILITGASGMLGRALHRRLLLPEASGYRVIGAGFSRLEIDHYPTHFAGPDGIEPRVQSASLHKLDLLDFDATTKFLRKHRPDVVVHCAAERYPDAFDAKPEKSRKLNVEGTRRLARECARLGAERGSAGPHLVYISTSYVFDGGAVSGRHPPYGPKSEACPINEYGRSKWDGERAVREELNDAGGRGGTGTIVRVPLLYGEDCEDLGESPALEMMKNFLPKELSGAAKEKKKAIDDWALRFPTSTEDVARVLKLAIDRVLEGKFPTGTYHVSSPHGTTKYELMRLQAKLMDIPRSVVDDRTVGNSAGPPANSAPRPRCTQLDCEDTWRALGLEEGGEPFEFVSLEDGMRRALDGFPERFLE
ncbi:hypothetical protein ACHAWF_002224 [Thalassiosira exigua]